MEHVALSPPSQDTLALALLKKENLTLPYRPLPRIPRGLGGRRGEDETVPSTSTQDASLNELRLSRMQSKPGHHSAEATAELLVARVCPHRLLVLAGLLSFFNLLLKDSNQRANLHFNVHLSRALRAGTLLKPPANRLGTAYCGSWSRYGLSIWQLNDRRPPEARPCHLGFYPVLWALKTRLTVQPY